MATPRRPTHGRRARNGPSRTSRKMGLRPVQFWLPDVRSAEFIAEAKRQSLAIAQSPQEQADLDFIESISDFITE